jgi:hypothetical protein
MFSLMFSRIDPERYTNHIEEKAKMADKMPRRLQHHTHTQHEILSSDKQSTLYKPDDERHVLPNVLPQMARRRSTWFENRVINQASHH